MEKNEKRSKNHTGKIIAIATGVASAGIVLWGLLNTPGGNRQFDRASPTPVPLKSYTLSAGPTPFV